MDIQEHNLKQFWMVSSFSAYGHECHCSISNCAVFPAPIYQSIHTCSFTSSWHYLTRCLLMHSGYFPHSNISPDSFLLCRWCPTFLFFFGIWVIDLGKPQMCASLLYNQWRMEEVRGEVTECSVPVLWRSNKNRHGHFPENLGLILFDWIWCWLMDSGSWIILVADWFRG